MKDRHDRAPARQTTVSFFSGRNNDCAPTRQTTVSFFFGRNNDPAPARQTTVSFFPVIIELSRHNKKTANFPPELLSRHNNKNAKKTNTTPQL